MKKLTEEHRDKPLAVLVDGKVISAPVVKSVISDKAEITGKFTKDEVEKLAKGIKGK
jgi:preprotein translocase subunit SecD